MAHFLRKAAIIGLIAMNSPVQSGKPADAARPETARQVASAARAEPHAAMGSLVAAREAAQILAGLDPELRGRVLAAASAATMRAPQR